MAKQKRLRGLKDVKIRHFTFQRYLWIFISLFALSALYVVLNVDLSRSVPPSVKYISFFSLILLALSVLISYYEYHGFGNSEGIIRRGPSQKVVALTFDDGPSPDYTPLILDILKKHNVKATFFLVGKHVEKYPEVARRIFAEGHEIGNHTYSHRDLVPSSKKKLKREILFNQEVIKKYLGIEPALFRPPRGIYSEAVRQFVVKNGLTLVLWSVSGIDWAGTPASLIAKRILRYTHPGAIILLHDSGALLRSEGHSRINTARSLQKVIPALKDKGYKFVTVSELIELATGKQTEVATEKAVLKT
jgi:peptidoglycan/xylan/chitin deacetylase (PgdA/CDA1 family)